MPVFDCDGADSLREAVVRPVDRWPTGYGRGTWPGFTDGLTDHLLTAEHPLVTLVLHGLDHVRDRDQDAVSTLLDLLAAAARWHLSFGRRLICLIETNDVERDLGVLGGEQPGWTRHEFRLVHRSAERLPPWITSWSHHQPITPSCR
ncbi:hypothetical protein AB0H12_17695 [Actinosynnema sp. NPDC023794]